MYCYSATSQSSIMYVHRVSKKSDKTFYRLEETYVIKLFLALLLLTRMISLNSQL